MVAITSETWTGTNGAAWPSQWSTGRNGTGSTATIQGNAGRLVNGSEGAYNGNGRVSRRINSGNIADGVVLFKFRWPSATVYNNYVGFWLRSNGSNANLLDGQTGFFFQAAFDFGGWKLSASSNYGALSGYTELSVNKTWATNQWYWVRFGVVGNLIKARVWNDGSPEPSTWDAESSQGNLISGSGAWGFSVGQGGHPSAQTEFDDFSADTAFPSSTVNYNVTTTQTVTAGSTVTGTVARTGAVTGTVTAGSVVTKSTQKIGTLQDNFTTPRTDLWDNISGGGGPVVSGGTMNIVPTTGYPSTSTNDNYSLVDSAASLQFVEAPAQGNGTTQGFVLQLRKPDGSAYVQWIYNNGSLIAEYWDNVGGFVTTAFVTYSTTDHAWLRIRESGGTIFWDRSADGTNWVNVASSTIPFTVELVKSYHAAGYYGTEPAPGTMRIDNYNITPVIVGAVTATATAAGVVAGASGVAGSVTGSGVAGHTVSGRVGKVSGTVQGVSAASAVGVGKFGAVTASGIAAGSVNGFVGKLSGATGDVLAGSGVSGVVGTVGTVTAVVTSAPTVGSGRVGAVSGVVTANPVVDGSVTAAGAVTAPINLGSFRSSADGTSGSFTCAVAAPVGRFVVVTLATNGENPTLSISDSKSNTWTRLATSSRSTGVLSTVTAWYTFVTNALTTSDTITVTRTGAGTLLFQGMVYQNVNPAVPIGNGGTMPTSSGTGTQVATTALSNVGNRGVVVMVAAMSMTYITAAPAAGYTEAVDESSSGTSSRGTTVLYRNITSTGSYTPQSNLVTGADWVAMAFAISGTGVSGAVSGQISTSPTVSGNVDNWGSVNGSAQANHSVVGRSGKVSGALATVTAGTAVSGSVAGTVGVTGTANAGHVVTGLVGALGEPDGTVWATDTVSGFLTTGPTAGVVSDIAPAGVILSRLGKTAGVNAPISPASIVSGTLGKRAQIVAGVLSALHDVRPSLGRSIEAEGTAIASAVVVGLVLTGSEARTGFVVGNAPGTYFVTEEPESASYPAIIGS